MKKTLSIITAAILLTSGFAGCGKGSDSSLLPNTVHSASDLEGKKIGTQFGTTGNILAGDVKDATVDSYKNATSAITALKQGKVDAVIIDYETAKAFLEKNDFLQMLDEDFAVEEYAIAYEKGNDELGEKLNDAIAYLKSSGKLDEINSHWIGDEPDHVSYVPDSSVSREGTIIMATNATFPPYESDDGSGIVGIDVDMMNAACDYLGMELKIEDMEFDGILAAISSGKADVGVAGISVTEDRKKAVDFTDGYAETRQVILTRKD